MCDNLTTKATDMASSISSSDSFEAVASVQEVAELKADLAEKTTEIDNLKEEVRGLKERDARKSRQLETLTQVSSFACSKSIVTVPFLISPGELRSFRLTNFGKFKN